ncbi:hypothetical protein LJD36_03660 [Bifidobacterium sp. MSK23_125]|nr:hypothetical protein [Bifidobacterium sp. MSK23_125]
MRLFADRPSQADGSRARIASAILNWERSLAHWKRVLTVIFSALLTVIAVVCLGVGLNIVGLGRDTQAIPPAPVTEVEAPQLPVPLTDDAIKAAGLHEATPTVSVSQMTATALDNLSAVDGSSALDTVAISLSSDQREQIEQNLQAFADAGAQVSFAVADLGSGGVIAANGGVARYPASSIKAPYIVSLLQEGAVNLDETASGSTLSAQINADHIAGVLRYSDNDGYDALWNAHLNSAIIPWSEGLVENPERMRGFQYPDVSAVELAKMWVKTYGYLFADAEGEPNAGETASAPAREWLASSMHHSLNSSIDAAHGGEENPDGTVVLGKAGWINGEGDYYALNDAGIVLPSGESGNEPGYAIAIMSNACGRNDLLADLAGTLHNILS